MSQCLIFFSSKINRNLFSEGNLQLFKRQGKKYKLFVQFCLKSHSKFGYLLTFISNII